MRTVASLSLAMLLTGMGAVAAAQSGPTTKGLGGGLGGGLGAVDPKAAALETELLAKIKALRAERKLSELVDDARLRGFSRRESELAARGDPTAGKIHERVKSQGLAPYGYWLQSLFGANAGEIFKALRADKKMSDALVGEFAKIGVGAFYVPDDKPYFQITVLLAQEPDPMAGKPGLTKQDTDAVMQGAGPRLKGCYDQALVREPNLNASVLFKIVIQGDGAVGEATFLNPSRNAVFDECALGVVRGLKFPAPYKGKPVTLNHPLRLTPPQGSKIVGKLSQAQIDAAFGRASVGFRNCYEARLKAKPQLAGTLVLGMRVLPDGGVQGVQIKEDGPQDLDLSRCVLERAQQLRFPPPEFGGELELSYPLRFDPPPPPKK